MITGHLCKSILPFKTIIYSLEKLESHYYHHLISIVIIIVDMFKSELQVVFHSCDMPTGSSVIRGRRPSMYLSLADDKLVASCWEYKSIDGCRYQVAGVYKSSGFSRFRFSRLLWLKVQIFIFVFVFQACSSISFEKPPF